MTVYSIEHDTMGEVRVPANALYAAQTQRAVENFPITSIAVAGVTNQYKKFNNYWEIPEVAAELKKVAKQQKGSGFVFDRRKSPQY